MLRSIGILTTRTCTGTCLVRRVARFFPPPERTRFVVVYYRALLVASSAAAARMYVVATIQILVLCFFAPGTGLPGRQ